VHAAGHVCQRLKNVEMKVLTGYHSYNSKMSCWYSSVKKHGGEGISALPQLQQLNVWMLQQY